MHRLFSAKSPSAGNFLRGSCGIGRQPLWRIRFSFRPGNLRHTQGKGQANSAFLLLGGADSGGDCEKAGNSHWNCEKQTFHSETEFQKAISIYFHGKGRSSIHEKISRFSPRIYHCGQRRTAFRSPLGGTGRVVPDSQIGRKMLLGYV